MAEETPISDAEWLVMKVVWDHQPVDSQLVVQQLAEPNDWTAATIKTMLHRLVKKQVLTFERDGKRYLYRALVRRGDCVRRASRSFLDRVFNGAAAPALMHLVKSSQLTDDELAALRRLINDKERKS